MLQIRFRNLVPDEDIVEAARDGYRRLRREAGGARHRMRCYITVCKRLVSDPDAQPYQVDLAILDEQRTVLRTRALGEDAGRLVGSSMLSACMIGAAFGASSPVWPAIIGL